MTAAALARLRAEVRADREALEQQVADAREALSRWRTGVPERAYVVLGAAAVHSWYTGLETIAERVARAVDGGVPTGDTWHRDVLSQAMSEVPGVRPHVLPRALQDELIALLGFRHFFRHAYAAKLDPAKVREHLDRLERVLPAVDAALDAFDRFLAGAIAAVSDAKA